MLDDDIEDYFDKGEGDLMEEMHKFVFLLDPLDFYKKDEDFTKWVQLAKESISPDFTKAQAIEVMNILLKKLEKREEYERCQIVLNELELIKLLED